MNKVRIILHIDMNAFFASCAIIAEPYLKNKVFAIGGPSGYTARGVLSTASYKARALGIHAGMPVAEAIKIYPRLLVVPTDFKLYEEKSRLFVKVLEEYSDLVLVGSIDEAYVDITELSKTKHPLQIAKEIQTRLYEDYQLPTSIGLGPTLFLAKMASNLKKPMGISVLRKKDVMAKLGHLSVNDIYGVGKKTSERLKSVNINLISDVLNLDNANIIQKAISKNHYEEIVRALNGQSSDVVDPYKHAVPKSIGSETTLLNPTDSYEILLSELLAQFETSFRRLAKHQMLAKTIVVKLKYQDFSAITRNETLFDYSVDKELFKNLVEEIFSKHYNDEIVRLIGVTFTNLIKIEDYDNHYDLFNYQTVLAKK